MENFFKRFRPKKLESNIPVEDTPELKQAREEHRKAIEDLERLPEILEEDRRAREAKKLQ